MGKKFSKGIFIFGLIAGVISIFTIPKAMDAYTNNMAKARAKKIEL